MKTLFLLILCILISSCMTTRPTRQAKYDDAEMPCDDPMYIVLQHKNVDSLTVREFEYLKTFQLACENQVIAEKQTSELKKILTEIKRNQWDVFLAGLLIPVAIGVVYLLAANASK